MCVIAYLSWQLASAKSIAGGLRKIGPICHGRLATERVSVVREGSRTRQQLRVWAGLPWQCEHDMLPETLRSHRRVLAQMRGVL